jgi:nucleoside-diphosphate-sugar epimerase
VFREFVTALLAAGGARAPDAELPVPVARAAAAAGEAAWRLLPLPGAPPVSRLALWLSALECTLDDGKAREQLGYEPVITREQGLTELQANR